jgi:serine/threonine protein kinase
MYGPETSEHDEPLEKKTRMLVESHLDSTKDTLLMSGERY